MPKVNLKKSRTKSYAEKLQERQERMNLIDRQETIFMPGEDLSDNDDDAPFEVETKREVLPLVEEEPALPEIKLQPKKVEKKNKKIIKLDDEKVTVKVDKSVKLQVREPAGKKKIVKNKMSFREQLLLANTKSKRKPSKDNSAHIEKWAANNKKKPCVK